jgi:hypothetical protein
MADETITSSMGGQEGQDFHVAALVIGYRRDGSADTARQRLDESPTRSSAAGTKARCSADPATWGIPQLPATWSVSRFSW